METNLPSSAVLECMPNRVTAVVFIGYFSTPTERATKDARPHSRKQTASGTPMTASQHDSIEAASFARAQLHSAQRKTLSSSAPSPARRLVCVDDCRQAARKRLPRAIFDFIDGAAGHEVTARAHEEAFRRYLVRPRGLPDG